MSLLLDALKKSGDKQGTGLSNLTLEDAPPPRASSTSSASASNRAAGETMFAAKKKKSSGGFRWNLGLVPTTLVIALVFGSGYGYYVWLEIQPPKHVAAVRTPPPAPAAAPVRAAPPVVAAAPHLAPLVPTLKKEEPTPVAEMQPVVTARNEDFDTPRSEPQASKPFYKPAAKRVVVRSKVKTDTITPTLLDAYQAYQRGDYVTAAQSYRDVLSKDQHNRDAILGLAAIAQQQGQSETAQQYYRQLLVLNPRDPAAQAALTNFSPDTGETESNLKLLLAEQPRSSALNFALGNYYADQSQWGDAQQSYFDAHTLDPANAQYTYNLAVSLDHLGQRKLAAQYYQQALQLDVSGHSGFDPTQAQQRLNELTQAH